MSTAEDTDQPTIRALLDFWFGALVDGLCADDHRQALFRADPAFDDEIRRRFGALIEAALAQRLDHWSMTAPGRLALVLLLDQFTRNIHRGTGTAWIGDPQALEFAREGVGRGDDRILAIEQRVFLYLPFEHSESLADQNTAVLLLERLQGELAGNARAQEVVAGYLRHALEHRDLIRRFGRFPHRNRALGRPSTAAEEAWLQADGRSFGQ